MNTYERLNEKDKGILVIDEYDHIVYCKVENGVKKIIPLQLYTEIHE